MKYSVRSMVLALALMQAGTAVVATSANALPIPRCEIKIECGVKLPF